MQIAAFLEGFGLPPSVAPLSHRMSSSSALSARISNEQLSMREVKSDKKNYVRMPLGAAPYVGPVASHQWPKQQLFDRARCLSIGRLTPLLSRAQLYIYVLNDK